MAEERNELTRQGQITGLVVDRGRLRARRGDWRLAGSFVSDQKRISKEPSHARAEQNGREAEERSESERRAGLKDKNDLRRIPQGISPEPVRRMSRLQGIARPHPHSHS